VEVLSPVCEVEPPATLDGGHSLTNSMRAIGALSPGRGPSLRIRV
jgi:hypothetical protein